MKNVIVDKKTAMAFISIFNRNGRTTEKYINKFPTINGYKIFSIMLKYPKNGLDDAENYLLAFRICTNKDGKRTTSVHIYPSYRKQPVHKMAIVTGEKKSKSLTYIRHNIENMSGIMMDFYSTSVRGIQKSFVWLFVDLINENKDNSVIISTKRKTGRGNIYEAVTYCKYGEVTELPYNITD